MEKVSVVIARWFINKNVLPAEDEELYAYAISCLLITVSPLFLVLVIGACLKLIVEGIVIIVPFMIIRTFSGGVHSGSPGRCFVISTGILLVLFMLTKVIKNSELLSIIMLAGCISLMICSPIENENKQLSDNEKKVYKRMTRIWVCVFAAIYYVLGYLGLNTYAVCVALGILLTAILQIPCLMRKMCSKASCK